MADTQNEYWYLEEGVDPNKILVPQLRSILLRHNVTYPASAKKPVLVDLFRQFVLPQAAKIQRTHARTKRSTRGIVDVPSSTASTTTDDADEDETLLAPPPAVQRTSRRTTRAATEEEQERQVPVRGKTPSRTVPTKHAREPEADDDGQPAMRRSRKSAAPAVKEPSPDPEAWHRPAADSPFTQDNPFQSGSSPLGPDAHARDRRRKSMGFEHKEKRRSDAYRRRTVQPKMEQQYDGVVVPTRKTFDVPAVRPPKDEPANELNVDEASEDFTPEEQLELVRERAKNGEIDVLPPRKLQRRSKAAGTAKAFTLTLFLTALAAFGGVWRQEKIDVGFCGVSPERDEPRQLAGVNVPEYLLPQCEPCPTHAICHPGLRVECEKDFVKKEHPLSLGGLIPLPPSCEADTDKTRKVNVVANQAVQILRKRRAQYECGEPDAEGNIVHSPEVNVDDIKRNILAVKHKAVSNEEFEDLFAKAIGETVLREEVVQTTEGPKQRLASNSLAELSLICSIRRSLRQSLERHLLTIVAVLVSMASVAYGKYSITSNRAMEARAKQLASDVFDRLANQAALAHQEQGTYQERGLSMNQLRDDVLRNEFSSSRRMKLWQRVQKKVENNSNIRAAVREGQSGDITRMWEWIGPVRMLDDGHGSGKRGGGRYSLGWDSPSSPPEAKETKETKQWEEGHPIY